MKAQFIALVQACTQVLEAARYVEPRHEHRVSETSWRDFAAQVKIAKKQLKNDLVSNTVNQS